MLVLNALKCYYDGKTWEKLINTKIFKKKIKKSGNLDWEIRAPTRVGVKNSILLNI